MESNLPEGCVAKFDDPDALHRFRLVISPPEGYWCGGIFTFSISVPEDYNIAVSILLAFFFLLLKYFSLKLC